MAALVGRSCGPATNALRVFQEEEVPKRGLALCHKFLFDPTQDYSKRFAPLRIFLKAPFGAHPTRTEADKKHHRFFILLGVALNTLYP